MALKVKKTLCFGTLVGRAVLRVWFKFEAPLEDRANILLLLSIRVMAIYFKVWQRSYFVWTLYKLVFELKQIESHHVDEELYVMGEYKGRESYNMMIIGDTSLLPIWLPSFNWTLVERLKLKQLSYWSTRQACISSHCPLSKSLCIILYIFCLFHWSYWLVPRYPASHDYQSTTHERINDHCSLFDLGMQKNHTKISLCCTYAASDYFSKQVEYKAYKKVA